MQPSTETVQEIWEIAHKIIGETFLHFSPADQLVVEERTHRLKLTYVSARMSPDPQDITQVNLSFDFDTCELWISLRTDQILHFTAKLAWAWMFVAGVTW